MTNNLWTLNETVSVLRRFICHITGDAYLAFVSVTRATNKLNMDFAELEMRFACFWWRFSCVFFCVQQKVWLFAGLWSVIYHMSHTITTMPICPRSPNSPFVALQLAIIYGVTSDVPHSVDIRTANINKRVRWMPNSDDKPRTFTENMSIFILVVFAFLSDGTFWLGHKNGCDTSACTWWYIVVKSENLFISSWFHFYGVNTLNAIDRNDFMCLP